MVVLRDYEQFDGLHWETGTIRNALAYQGVRALHTNEAYSEALLMGVSGGAAFGYFLFDYQGHDPILSLITRNTFDPMNILCERLGIRQTILQTTDERKGDANLLEVLDSGRPAVVWADQYSLPYNCLEDDPSNWAMLPVLVYGVDEERVYIADRSRRPLSVSRGDFARARGRVKKDKHRVIRLDSPDERKLVSGVLKGLWQCIGLFTEMPPKGARHNFGFAAYQHWADMLTNTRNPHGWKRFFPPGRRLYAALAGHHGITGVYPWIRMWGAGDGAERGMYADFIEEAAVILNKPILNKAAELFRLSQAEWIKLSELALPEEVPLLKQTRQLLQRRHELFLDRGDTAGAEIRLVDQTLMEIRKSVAREFPLDEQETSGLMSRMRESVLAILDLETQAVKQLQNALQ